MSLSITQARDEMLTMLKDAIEASSYSTITIRYQDISQEREAAAASSPDPYLCAEVQHIFGGQTSLGRPARFTRRGLIRVSIFNPRGSGMSTSDEIAQIVLDAYEGQSSPGGVWFRNATVREAAVDGIWTRVDVVIDFTYNEQK